MRTFPCGCTFETDSNGRIIFDPDVEKLPKDCSATWDLICEGNTKGVFQLEIQGSNAQKVQPRSIDELSALSHLCENQGIPTDPNRPHF